jgi:hypothetical protein
MSEQDPDLALARRLLIKAALRIAEFANEADDVTVEELISGAQVALDLAKARVRSGGRIPGLYSMAEINNLHASR